MDAVEMHNIAAAGFARYSEWKRQFLDDWRKAIAEGNERKVFALLPSNVKEAMKAANPEQYAMIESRLIKRK